MKVLRPDIFEFLRSGCILSSDASSGASSSASNDCWIGWGNCKKASSPDLNSALNLYSPDFFLKDSTPWRIFPHACKLSQDELSELIIKNPSTPSVIWKAAEFQDFRMAFEDLQRQFERGVLRKAVPIVLEEGEFQEISRANLISQLLRSTKSFPLYLYGVWDQEEGILGATPEILFKQTESGRLNTVAIAGTRSRPLQGDTNLPSLLPSLLDDPKEMEEHRIVIEGISNSLSGLGEVNVGVTQEIELPSLVHLMTPMTLVLPTDQKTSEFGFEKFVRCLHPTPALGAFPKKEGRHWLENFQFNQKPNQKRKKFGAPFGIIIGATYGSEFGASSLSGESLCVVAIRNIQWQGSSCIIGAGCGVVRASQLEKECDELRAKIKSVKKSFNII